MINVEHYNLVAEEKNWSPVLLYKGNLIGYWWFGRWYNQTRVEGIGYYYGAYPAKFLERVKALLYPVFETGKVLHLFSGTLRGDGDKIVTLDIKPELKPNVVANAEEMPFQENTFDLILADPPYEDNWKKYGTKKIKKRKVFSECRRVLKPGGYLVWLDTIVPQWRKAEFQYRGVVAVLPSTNHKTRTLLFLEVVK